jgi:hypothetical protein
LFKKPKDACEAILMLILRASYLKWCRHALHRSRVTRLGEF